MKKNRSMPENDIVEYCFAALPVNLCFQTDVKKSLHLYYQKNKQIISSFKLQNICTRTGQVLQFDCPPYIDYFQSISDKNLDYRWSFYAIREENGIQKEEFIQAEKISLKPIWDEFLLSKGSKFVEIRVPFQFLKCWLSFIVVIGTTEEQIFQIATSIFTQKKKQKSKQLNQMKIENQRKDTKLNKSQFKQLQYQIPTCQSNIIPNDSSSARLSILKSQTYQIKNLGLPQGDGSKNSPNESLTLEIHPFPQLLFTNSQKELTDVCSIIEQQKDTNSSYFQKRKKDTSPILLHLSVSQMEIGNQIEQKIQAIDSFDQPLESHIKLSIVSPRKQALRVPTTAIVSSQKIRMTASQYINSEGEIVILPFYTQFKYVAVILAIILIFSMLIVLRPQFKIAPSQQIDHHQKIEIKAVPSVKKRKEGKRKK